MPTSHKSGGRSPRSVSARVIAVVAIAVGGVSLAQKLEFTPVERAVVLERVKDAPAVDLQRAARIKDMFVDSGCNGNLLQEQPATGATPNIICELPGNSGATVIIGAHYDRNSSAGRPFDNWSGATLLPALYQSLRGHKRRHTFIFVAFADQGKELAGAEVFADRMSAPARRRTEAMVNLDVLGLSPTKVWTSHSDKDLVHDLVVMVYSLKLPASQIDMETSGATDSEPFAARHIPRITIHSLTQQNLEGALTPFRPDNYYDTYRLLCGYLAFLDVTLKPRSHAE